MLEKNENPKTKQPITPTIPILKKLSKGLNISTSELLQLTLINDIKTK